VRAEKARAGTERIKVRSRLGLVSHVSPRCEAIYDLLGPGGNPAFKFDLVRTAFSFPLDVSLSAWRFGHQHTTMMPALILVLVLIFRRLLSFILCRIQMRRLVHHAFSGLEGPGGYPAFVPVFVRIAFSFLTFGVLPAFIL
jgi:hypothetical protein